MAMRGKMLWNIVKSTWSKWKISARLKAPTTVSWRTTKNSCRTRSDSFCCTTTSPYTTAMKVKLGCGGKKISQEYCLKQRAVELWYIADFIDEYDGYLHLSDEAYKKVHRKERSGFSGVWSTTWWVFYWRQVSWGDEECMWHCWSEISTLNAYGCLHSRPKQLSQEVCGACTDRKKYSRQRWRSQESERYHVG